MLNVVYKMDCRRLLKHQMYAWIKPIDTAFRDHVRAILPTKGYWISIRTGTRKAEIRFTWLNSHEANFFGSQSQTVFWIHYLLLPARSCHFWFCFNLYASAFSTTNEIGKGGCASLWQAGFSQASLPCPRLSLFWS